MENLKISPKEAGQRLDKFLQKYLSSAGKSFLYKMMRKKNILLNGKRVRGNEKLQEGDWLTFYLSPDTIAKFQKAEEIWPYMDLDILYEDDHILAINKPAGLLSQKSKADDRSVNDYLIGWLLEKGRLSKEDLVRFRPSICNRLDRNTTGILLAGKTVKGLQTLSSHLKDRSLKKEYLCLVHGHVKKEAHVRGFLVKEERANKVFVVKEGEGIAGGEAIETAYKPLAYGDGISLLQVELITGKSHQIRAHLASEGHWILGDGKYGDPKINGKYRKTYKIRSQLLHSWQVTFPATAEDNLSDLVIRAPLPAVWERTAGELLKEGALESL